MRAPAFAKACSDRPSLCVFAAMLALFILIADGRTNSGDAAAQLEASIHLVQKGTLGAKSPPGLRPSLWVRAPNGLFYEAHDLGNTLVFIPAAVVETFSPSRQLGYRPRAQFWASITYSAIAAVGSAFFFQLMRNWYSIRASFGLTLVFVFSTILLPYTKTCWDVVPGCVFTIWVIDRSLKLRDPHRPGVREAAWLGIATAIACTFRYSLTPYLVLACAIAFRMARKRVTWVSLSTFVIVLAIGLLPTFWYNALRTGSSVRPATTAPQFDDLNGLAANPLPGLVGLLGSPNRGLLPFDPIFVLLLWLPMKWRSLPHGIRWVSVAFGPPMIFYVLLISVLKNWGTFGWGPRYLIPVLPILFLPVAGLIAANWKKRKGLLMCLIGVSTVINVAPTLVDWTLASTGTAGAVDPYSRLPRQQMAVWKALWLGLEGKPLPIRREIFQTGYLIPGEIPSQTALFPDSWLVRIGARSQQATFLAGLIAFGLAAVIVCACSLLWVSASNQPLPQSTQPNPQAE